MSAESLITEVHSPDLENKVWGKVRHAFQSEGCAVSILHTKRGGFCSKHLHQSRINRFIVVEGCIEVMTYVMLPEISDDVPAELKETTRIRLQEGDILDVPARVYHSFEVIESGIVVEVYWPDRVDMDDIVRISEGGMKKSYRKKAK